MSNKIIVCCGLPGSGKTTFACKMAINSENANEYFGFKFLSTGNRNVMVADFDFFMKSKYNQSMPIEQRYQKAFEQIKDALRGKENWTVIIDGLFLNHEDYLRIAQAFKDYHITYHWWEPLRDVCIHNDKYRRDKDSVQLIKNAAFEAPDPVALKLVNNDINNIEIVKHIPVKKSGYRMFCDKYNLYSNLKSESWSNGGSSYDCYGHSHHCSASSPVEFKEFDDLLESINEDIKFMQYKKIRNECVDVETYGDAGYYGGDATSSEYVCNTRLLYNILIEMGLLLEEFL